ncbi:DUF551 domain-containing protein [Escherichia coli]|nr:DUF551 domain-containing protein [Escherichia coli]
MSTITKELAKLFRKITNSEIDAEGNAHVVLSPADSLLINNARIALASLEAEAVAWAHRLINKRNGVVHPWVYGSAEACPSEGDIFNIEVMPLYTAPPAPVSVPAAMEIDDDFDSAFEHGKAVGWNAYRAAMLQAGNFLENKNSSTNNFREIAETSTNYPVIPSEVLSAIQKVAKIRADFDDFDGDRRGIGDCLDEAEQELIVTINKYASQLAAEPIAPNDVREQTAIPQVPVTPDGWISCSDRMPNDAQWCVVNTEYGYYVQCWSEGQGWLGDDISIPKCDVINWMPLPEPPQEVN